VNGNSDDSPAEDPAANYYGNTLHVMPLDEAGAHCVLYNADKSFEVHFSDRHYRGNYSIEGDQVRLTAIRPGDDQESTNCYYFDRTRRAGDSWTETTSQGTTRFRLDRGRR
jgi:hypothetical protein